MMEAFGELLRYNLDNFSRIVTLRDEVDNARDYVAILKIRFGNRIDFAIGADECIMDARIPSLILQPLVENAIIHGVGTYTGNARVRADVRALAHGRVELLVWDNGVGTDAKTLARLRQGNRGGSAAPDDTSIGLTNVFKHLRIFFNDDVDIHIDSEPGSHFEIRIDMPLLCEQTVARSSMERG